MYHNRRTIETFKDLSQLEKSWHSEEHDAFFLIFADLKGHSQAKPASFTV